jgi:hypothetical protein
MTLAEARTPLGVAVVDFTLPAAVAGSTRPAAAVVVVVDMRVAVEAIAK